MNQVYTCVSCESRDVRIVMTIKRLRPNGDFMKILKCTKCGCKWEE